MALGEFIGGGPTRQQSGNLGSLRDGISNPNYQPMQGPEIGPHPWLQPHERTQYFEQNPQQAFQAFAPQFGQGHMRQGIMSGFGDIMNAYQGQLARTILSGGEAPQGGFVDFLSGTRGYDSPFDFQGWYRNRYPGASEMSDQRYTPSIRYLF